MKIENVLIVDDEPLISSFLSETLRRKGYATIVASSAKEGLKAFAASTFDLVITDMSMEKPHSGIDLLRGVKERAPNTLVLVMTAFGTIENAVEAMRLGAFHYLLKPFTLDSIETLLEKAEEHTSLLSENTYLRKMVVTKDAPHEIIAFSPSLKKILEEGKKIAQSGASVMLQGESGTGKEVIASFLHTHSQRRDGPYIRVNCAAIPESLIESEFFGHEKGSFTNAHNKRIGRFELADRGTLFLDEVTEIPINLQPKLLRAIQEREFERVGGTKSVGVDVRIISSSNRDLKEAIEQKILREDLYYRLNVIPIHIPPLREREEDILPLAEYFLQKHLALNHKKGKELTQETKKKLTSYHWPGNVRELSNVIERAVVLGDFVLA